MPRASLPRKKGGSNYNTAGYIKGPSSFWEREGTENAVPSSVSSSFCRGDSSSPFAPWPLSSPCPEYKSRERGKWRKRGKFPFNQGLFLREKKKPLLLGYSVPERSSSVLIHPIPFLFSSSFFFHSSAANRYLWCYFLILLSPSLSLSPRSEGEHKKLFFSHIRYFFPQAKERGTFKAWTSPTFPGESFKDFCERESGILFLFLSSTKLLPMLLRLRICADVLEGIFLLLLFPSLYLCVREISLEISPIHLLSLAN